MSNETRRILLVEDEKAIRDAVAAYLERENYWVTAVGDGQEALEEFSKHHFDLVILDLMLPQRPRRARLPRRSATTPTCPSSCSPPRARSRTASSAWSWVPTTTWSSRSARASWSPAPARCCAARTPIPSPSARCSSSASLTIDVSGHKVMVSGKEIDLTASEFKLLTTLSRYPGRVYSRMELVEKVLGYDFEGYERTIDSHVKNLRAKIGDNPRNPKWLHTVHGVGYRFEDPTKQGQ